MASKSLSLEAALLPSVLTHPVILQALQELKDSRSQKAAACALARLAASFKAIDSLAPIEAGRIQFIGQFFEAALASPVAMTCGDIGKIQSVMIDIGNLKNALQIEGFFYGSLEPGLSIFFNLMKHPAIKELISHIPDIATKARYNPETFCFEIEASVFIDFFDGLLIEPILESDFYILLLSLQGMVIPPKEAGACATIIIPYENLPSYEGLVPYLNHEDGPTKLLSQILCFCGIEKILSLSTLLHSTSVEYLIGSFAVKDHSSIEGKDAFLPFLTQVKKALDRSAKKNLSALLLDAEFALFFERFSHKNWLLTAAETYQVLLKMEPSLNIRMDADHRYGVSQALEAHGSDPMIREFMIHISKKMAKKGFSFKHPLAENIYCRSKEEFLLLPIQAYTGRIQDHASAHLEDEGFASIAVAKKSSVSAGGGGGKKGKKSHAAKGGKALVKEAEVAAVLDEKPTFETLTRLLLEAHSCASASFAEGAAAEDPELLAMGGCAKSSKVNVKVASASGGASTAGAVSKPLKTILPIDPALLESITHALGEAATYVSNLAIDARILSFFEEGAPEDPVHQAPLELLPILFSPMHAVLDDFDERSERRRAIVIVEKKGVSAKHILEATKLKDSAAKRRDGKHSLLYHWNIKAPKTCRDFFKIQLMSPHEYPAVCEAKAAKKGAASGEEEVFQIDLRSAEIRLDHQGNAIFTQKDGTIYTVLYLRKA
jgi:hypothetical protein